MGFEPTTPTLARLCSTTELISLKLKGMQIYNPIIEIPFKKEKNYKFIFYYFLKFLSFHLV
jgi:hypothetical protein